MEKKADTWMPWYVADYLADTLNLNTEQHGAYCLMLMACWKGDGRLPSNDDELSAITKLAPAKWRAHRNVLLRFFRVDGNCLTHKRVTEERQKAKETSNKRSKIGKEGAERRWQRESEGIANAMANTIANASQTDAPSPSPVNPSVPDGTGAGAPPDSAAVIFSLGVPLLTTAGVSEKNARSMLGLMRKQNGDDAVIGALQRCATEKPLDPVAWLQATVKSIATFPNKRTTAKTWADQITGANHDQGRVIDSTATAVR